MIRSRFRSDALDKNDTFTFAQIVVDGYSGDDINDGYLTGILLKVGSPSGQGSTKLELHADDGQINQLGTGDVDFRGNVHAHADVTVDGDLVVNGTRTELNVEQLTIEDPVEIFNVTGTQALTDWSGFASRDNDGYNRMGFVFDSGLTDGYWALSVSADSDADAVPDRAIAYLGAGDSYGDLSSTIDGNSGADKVAITPISGLAASSVQDALEEINGNTGGVDGTTNLTFTINEDATPAADEDPCLVLKGGDGTSLIDGYMCLITDSGAGDRFELRIFEGGTPSTSGTPQVTDLHLGSSGATDNIDARLTFNAGDGSSARTANILLDGDQDRLEFTASAHLFDGYAEFLDSVAVFGRLDAYGNTRLGNSAADTLQVDATIISDLLPTDCTYALGRPGSTWEDGYFCFFTPDNYTPTGSSESLQGHLKGIDDALASAGAPNRGIYEITMAEAIADELDTARAVDLGDRPGVSGFTDEQFLTNVFVYLDGQLLVNDASPAASTAAVVNDVARETGDLSVLLFATNIKNGSAVQVVDMT